MKKNVEANTATGLAIEGRDSTAIGLASGPLAKGIRVVLCRPRHPGNIGAAARALKTMGLARLYLVDPERYAEAPDIVEATARATGAADVLTDAVICASLDEALEGVHYAAALTARVREVSPPRKLARAAAEDLWQRAAGGEDVALVFGSETAGLTNDEVIRCDLCVSLPANPAYSSLNLAAAVQILCYELRVASLAAPVAADGADTYSPGIPRRIDPTTAPETMSPLATREDVEGFITHLETVMGETGFFDTRNPKRLISKLRRLFSRTSLERDEINILRGFLASVTQFRRK